MLDLQKMRKDIDVIDTQIVKLFEERMKICEDVAQFKIETGKPVFDKTREQEKLEALGSKAHNDFNRCGVQELFEQIMSISRKRQYQLLQENGIEEKSDFVKIEDLKKENATVVFQGSLAIRSKAFMWTPGRMPWKRSKKERLTLPYSPLRIPQQALSRISMICSQSMTM